MSHLFKELSSPFIHHPLQSKQQARNPLSRIQIMESLRLPVFLKFPRALRSQRDNQQSKNAMMKNFPNRFPPIMVKKFPRRVLLQFIGFNMMSLSVYPVFAAPMLERQEAEVIGILKLPSGVRIQEVIHGEGREACEGDLVEVNYVCRRSNGYFVHSTVDQFSGESSPVVLPLDENQIIKGLKEVLVGMRIGGKRRALIPPSVGYVNENLKPVPEEFGPRRSLFSHVKEPLVFEVQLLRIL